MFGIEINNAKRLWFSLNRRPYFFHGKYAVDVVPGQYITLPEVGANLPVMIFMRSKSRNAAVLIESNINDYRSYTPRQTNNAIKPRNLITTQKEVSFGADLYVFSQQPKTLSKYGMSIYGEKSNSKFNVEVFNSSWMPLEFKSLDVGIDIQNKHDASKILTNNVAVLTASTSRQVIASVYNNLYDGRSYWHVVTGAHQNEIFLKNIVESFNIPEPIENKPSVLQKIFYIETDKYDTYANLK
ncbi:hypothetical protein [Thorsellia anophelis]|uniref:Uncharacterized protein n=1 Tax=Thorsellia anophelis DSM 18579 TaxID=1123402 RepID=A0A1I0D6R9_9GAMM|nr:hypothetical protein [Thorsellia anophelis]SET27606.1 hypothetical protein SAMN02583745_01861 [Thorsellia anophelis DSM 18579]